MGKRGEMQKHEIGKREIVTMLELLVSHHSTYSKILTFTRDNTHKFTKLQGSFISLLPTTRFFEMFLQANF